jgi:hypothetical protein
MSFHMLTGGALSGLSWPCHSHDSPLLAGTLDNGIPLDRVLAGANRQPI